MSKTDGHKVQMALIDLKSRREELKLLQETCRGADQMRFQTTIEYRIHKLTEQIEVIEGKRLKPKEQE